MAREFQWYNISKCALDANRVDPRGPERNDDDKLALRCAEGNSNVLWRHATKHLLENDGAR